MFNEDRIRDAAYDRMLDKQSREGDWLENRVNELLKDECNPYEENNIFEAIENGSESMGRVFAACFAEAKDANFRNDTANHMTIMALANLVEKYWEDAAEKQAEKDLCELDSMDNYEDRHGMDYGD